MVLTTLVNELAAADVDIVLLLDDYHVIEAPAVHEGMAFLLAHLPARLHLVLATRSDPPLPLPRLRARGDLVEVRAADLRFTDRRGRVVPERGHGTRARSRPTCRPWRGGPRAGSPRSSSPPCP